MQDAFNWSIAGYTTDNTYINILSELAWKNLKSNEILIAGSYRFKDKLLVRAIFSKASIYDGTVSDTDFQKSNRKDAVYSGVFESNDGQLLSYGLTGGYCISLTDNISITPFIGYGAASQELYISEDKGPANLNLQSTYDARWLGYKVGFEMEFAIGKKLNLLNRFTYNQIDYSADANWNLIDVFQHPVSFTHKSKGFGIVPEVIIGYSLTPFLKATLRGQFSYWNTGEGEDKLFLQNGQVLSTPLNKVERKSKGISIGLSVNLGRLLEHKQE
ncbi:hypothetical protein N824_10785 [Pedobacter sp. V48]|nr:hypothetical protein N824_10785 [Pedobacter sp. V48]